MSLLFFFFLRNVCSPKRSFERRKDLCKQDGSHRGVEGARCRSPEGSVYADPAAAAWTELVIARRKDLCKLDGPHRGVDGARCRSPEGSV